MENKDSKKKAKLSEDKRTVEYSRDEIESLLPNLTRELAGDQYNPLEIVQENLERIPRSHEEIKKTTKSQYDPDTELFSPKTEDYLRRCSTIEEAEEIINHQFKINEITKEQANELRKLCKKHGLGYFGQKKEWGYYEKTYRNKRNSV